MIDLRSDTITKPSDAMRSAIANAPVGDDVYHGDPTVNALEERTAEILGKEEAVYVPSGTMGNQIAVRLHTQPGDSVVLETDAHIGTHEIGGAALHSGVTLQRIDGDLGTFTAEQLEAKLPIDHPALPSHLLDPYTLVCLENTHNAAGGTIWSLEQMRSVTDRASTLGLATHLDGARLWNASAATGTDMADYAAGVDTVSVCFSKGLGAPVGSALAGSSELMFEARRLKHMFGGGMRQAGMIAAGAMYALENNRERIVEDHANALAFANGIADVDGVTVAVDTVHTNIVYFDVADPGPVVDAAYDAGAAMLATGATQIRAVFSLEVDATDTAKAIDVVASAVSSASSSASSLPKS
jgi:threonine aldolase